MGDTIKRNLEEAVIRKRAQQAATSSDGRIASAGGADTQPKTLSVPDAGRIYYNLGKNASYAAAASGQIPTIRIGKLLRVPVRLMERKLDNAG